VLPQHMCNMPALNYEGMCIQAVWRASAKALFCSGNPLCCMHVQALVFNPFQENTYVLWDATGECIIVDPGCSLPYEQSELNELIQRQGLRPVRLLLTHCHIDHVLGCAYVHRTWGLLPEHHIDETAMLANLPQQSMMFGIPAEASPAAVQYLVPGQDVHFGNTALQVLFTPGHSPASVCLHHAPTRQCISGDVLFAGSIGRTDLPGGNYERLLESIVSQLLPLGDDVTIYPGHGPATTLGHEKRYNPYIEQRWN